LTIPFLGYMLLGKECFSKIDRHDVRVMSENNEISTNEINSINDLQIPDKREQKMMIILSFIASVISQSCIILLAKPNLIYQPLPILIKYIVRIFITALIFAIFLSKEIGIFLKIERKLFKYIVFFSACTLLSLFLYELMFLIKILQAEYKLSISFGGLVSLVAGLSGLIIESIYFDSFNDTQTKKKSLIWYLIGSILISFSMSFSIFTHH
jgi:hypothetical protein